MARTSASYSTQVSTPVNSRADRAKSLLGAPFEFISEMTHKERPNTLAWEMLRRMARQDIIAAAIVQTRVAQVAQFAKQQRTRYDMGFRVELRYDKARAMTKSEMEKARQLELMMLNTSTKEYAYKRDDFEVFLRKMTRDSFELDQGAMEMVNTLDNTPYEWYAVDGSTIRFALHPEELDIPQGLYDDAAQAQYRHPTQPIAQDSTVVNPQSAYVQVYQGRAIRQYTEDEMGLLIRNYVTDLARNGYGVAELEVLVMHVTAQLFQEQYNRHFFSNGAAIKGILAVDGNFPESQLQAFRTQWQAQVAGVGNAWRMPVFKASDLKFVNMHSNNRDMEWAAYSEYLIKCHCALFQIAPDEIAFDLKPGSMGSQNAPLFESSNEARIKWSKDRGLKPMLSAIERVLNNNIIWRLDPRFELVFRGLDAKSEQEQIDLRTKEGQNYKNLNEVRAEDNLPPFSLERFLENPGDIPLNPVLQQIIMQMLNMQLQREQMQIDQANQQQQMLAAGAPAEAPVDAEVDEDPEDRGDWIEPAPETVEKSVKSGRPRTIKVNPWR